MRYKIPLETDNALSIGFHKGPRKSVVNSLAASAGIRGGRKEIVFDEFAHIPKNEDLFKAALPAIMNGEIGMDIVSTPMGRQNLFADIWFNEEDGKGKRHFSQFSRHEFIWFETQRFLRKEKTTEEARRLWELSADEGGFGRDFNRMNEFVDEFANEKLVSIRDMYPTDYFQQEFCGHFIDDSTALFPWDLITKCLRGPLGSADDFTEEYLEPWTERPEDNNNYCVMGVDFGQSGASDDKTAIHVLEKARDGTLKHRFYKVLDKRYFPDFPAQATEIVRIASTLKVNKINADATGLGLGIVPLIQKLGPGLHVEGVNFNAQEKEQMVMNLKTLMEQDQLWLLAADTLTQAEIHGIRGDVTPSGRIRYHGEPHDDNFWALALAAREGTYKHFAVYTIDSLMKGL